MLILSWSNDFDLLTYSIYRILLFYFDVSCAIVRLQPDVIKTFRKLINPQWALQFSSSQNWCSIVLNSRMCPTRMTVIVSWCAGSSATLLPRPVNVLVLGSASPLILRSQQLWNCFCSGVSIAICRTWKGVSVS